MIRVFVTYTDAPDEARYQQHLELCARVPGATFRHGKVLRTLHGDPLGYYAEFEWPDQDAFKADARSDEFMATGKDVMEHGDRITRREIASRAMRQRASPARRLLRCSMRRVSRPSRCARDNPATSR